MNKMSVASNTLMSFHVRAFAEMQQTIHFQLAVFLISDSDVSKLEQKQHPNDTCNIWFEFLPAEQSVWHFKKCNNSRYELTM